MLTVQAIDNYADFLKTEPFWDSLLESSGELNIPFLAFEWLRIWWQVFGKGKEMLVLVLKQDGEPACAVPLMKSRRSWRGLPVTCVSSLANEHSVRSGIIGSPQGVREGLAACLSHLLGKRFDMLWFDFLPEDSCAAAQLDRTLPEFGLKFRKLPASLSPYIRISGSWEEYLLGRSRNLREKLKRLNKHYSGDGLLTVRDDPGGVMGKIIAISRNTWKYREGTAIASGRDTVEFYRRYAERAAAKGMLKIMLLQKAGRPLAFTYELKYLGRDYFVKAGFDENYAALSPGIFILGASIREAFSSGCREYDLLGANEGYKMKFTQLVRPHCKYRIFNNSAYGFLLHAVENKAIPLVKRLVRALPRLTRRPAHSLPADP